MNCSDGEARPQWGISAFVVLVVCFVGYIILSSLANSHRLGDMAAVARYKAEHISAWLDERRGDVHVLARSDALKGLTKHWLAQPNDNTYHALHEFFESYRQAYRYKNFQLISASGKILFDQEDPSKIVSPTERYQHLDAPVRQNVLQGQVDHSDFHPGTSNALDFLSVLATGGHQEPVIMVLTLDPTDFLLPFLGRWIYPEETTPEGMLVFRDGLAWHGVKDNGEILALGDLDGVGNRAVASLQKLPGGVWGALQPIENDRWAVMVMDNPSAVRERALFGIGITLVVAVILTALTSVLQRFFIQRRLLNESEILRESQLSLLQEHEKLLVSNQRFEDIAKATHDWIWETDTDSRFVYVSENVQALLGYSTGEMLGLRFRDVANPSMSGDALQRLDFQKNQTGKAHDIELELFHLDGSPRSVICNGFPVRGTQGELLGYRGVVHDVTAKKAKIEELKILRLAVEQSMNLVILADTNRKIVYVNEAFVEATGFTFDEVVGRPAGFNSSGNTPRETFESLDQAMTKGEQWKGRFYNRTKAGEEIIFFALISPIRQEDGRVSHYLSVMEDVTSRVRLGEELDKYRNHLEELVQERTSQLEIASQTAEERGKLFREAVNSVSQGFVVFDRADRILTCNEAYIDCYREIEKQLQPGVQFGEIIQAAATHCVRVPTDEHLDWIRARMQSHIKADGQVQELQLKNGRWLLVMEFKTPSGYTVGNHIDITAIKQAEQMMSDARDAANAANKAKSSFLANMSHEIRTPMNAILGLTKLCLQTELNTKQRDYITKTNKAATILLAIINDILDFSKIEAGKLHIESVSFNLEELIGNITNMFFPMAQERQLGFDVTVAPDVPNTIIGDSLRLGQVITNLLSNALKFTDKGAVSLSVRAKDGPVKPGQKARIEFTVKDTGIGMSEDQLARLFNEFSQADTSITRKYGGTGLGLTICRQLVGLMQGVISVESKPGAGSLFTFEIECLVAEYQDMPLAKLAPRVLVIDDENIIRVMMVRMLEKFGCRPVAASSGPDALKILADRDDIDLVLLDWKMPEMDGLETAKAILSLPGKQNLPIVMVTAASMGEIQDLETHGIRRYLFKPIQYSLFYDAIHEELAELSPHEKSPMNVDFVRGKRILVVEDNELNQQVAREILEGEGGAIVTIAENGIKGIEALEEESFDLVFMDMQMPVMDGVTATKAIRGLPKFDAIPIIAMTANALPEEKQQCLDAGMNDFLTKPIVPETLFGMMAKWLGADAPLKLSPAPVDSHDGEPRDWPTFEFLDVEAGIFYANGTESMYAKLLKVFVRNGDRIIAEVTAAMAQNDMAGIKRAAHSMKGMAGTIGGRLLQKCSAELELQAGQEGAMVDMARVVADLQACYTRTKADVETYLANKDFVV